MKFSASDLQLIRWSILAICASALSSAAILYGSGKYAKKSQKEYLSARRVLDDAHNNLSMARQDQENMGKYADEYGALLRQRIVGDDQRMDWMEGLEKIRRNNPVINFSYQIEPRKIYSRQSHQQDMDSGNFDIHYSEMKLQFDLLHEVQLLKFFDALNANIKGHYHMEGCTLQRLVAVEDQSRIKAECSGGWITLKKRNTVK